MKDLIPEKIMFKDTNIEKFLEKASKQNSLINFKNICSDYARDYYTNLIHSYPAKMYGPIAQSLMYLYAKKGDTILDPFCGTGTVLMQAKLYGMNSIGYDINPLACLISRAKTTTLRIKGLRKSADELFASIDCKTEISTPSFSKIDFWFDKDNKRDLARILSKIKEVANKKYRTFFMVCFSSIIRKASNADPEIKPPVRTKRMLELRKNGESVNVIEEFKDMVEANIKRLEKFCKDCDKKTTARVIRKDIRDVIMPKNSVDLVITSPPYIGSQKYIRSTRLELLWLNLANNGALRDLDINTIGAERISAEDIKIEKLNIQRADDLIGKIEKVDRKRAYMVFKYFSDIERCAQILKRALKKNKCLIFVVGDNTVRKVHVPTHKIISDILIRNGFKMDKILKDKIKYRGFMKKRNQTAGIIDYEWILIFKKG